VYNLTDVVLCFKPHKLLRVHTHTHTHHRCDSFCFNPHKLLGVSSQCTLLLLNSNNPDADACCQPGALQRSNDTVYMDTYILVGLFSDIIY